MTPNEAASELKNAITVAIERYEKAVPGICTGIYVDRSAGGFTVKLRLACLHQSHAAQREKAGTA